VRSEEATSLWRCALPRAGWWRNAQRARLPTRPLRPRQSKRDEGRTRPAWWPERSWSRRTRGVWLRVIGAVHEGPSQVFSTIVPPFDAQALRPERHHGMATFRPTAQEGVMVVERSGSHRAHKLDATLDHSHGTCRFHGCPAPCGHDLTPIAGFWRVRKDRMGAGRCFADLPQRYPRPRQGLMAHQARPRYAFHWERIPPRT